MKREPLMIWPFYLGGSQRYRRVLLQEPKRPKGGFCRLLGRTQIELIEPLERASTKIYQDRYWGDLGLMHLCFDLSGMDGMKKAAAAWGFPFTVDSQDGFHMGEAGGCFSYIEDPAGTLIEFVETHRLPLMKKWDWYLNLQKRNPHQPLPNWIVRALAFKRVRG